MEKRRIRVVWVTMLSNNELRKRLHLRRDIFDIYKKRSLESFIRDYGKWNANAINEFKKYDDLELHVISSHSKIASRLQEFTHEGIHYHIYRPEQDYLSFRLRRKLIKGDYETSEYRKNSKTITSIINRINPDIVHYIGAEIPEYSSSALNIDPKFPLMVSLQTLMCDPDFKANYPISDKMYAYRSGVEVKVIKRADFVCCKSDHFKEIIWNTISPNIRILDLALAVGENITKATFKKEHTFIYFAKEIEKAADWAIEAFAIVNKRYPDTTLRIVGGYQTGYKRELDERLSALGITERVTFTGSLPTHDDVINEVRKSTFAVLPLKIDLIAGTIREAMANGIPVVTTITPATPELNEKRKSIMLSEKGDFNGMANNMMELIENKTLAEQLQANAYETLKDRYDNETIAKQWHDSYFEVLEHISNGTPISLEATNRL